jgi:putative transposase
MTNNHHQLYAQAVFAVKYLEAAIHPGWKDKLFTIIGNLINEAGCESLIVNGVEDHVHCFFAFKTSTIISDLMESVMAKSSKWVNENSLLPHRFEWQEGYGAFSCCQSEIDTVYKYVQNQEVHHRTQTFREEYVATLVAFGIDFDERKIFKDLE